MLEVNSILTKTQKLYEGELIGPESIAVDSTGSYRTLECFLQFINIEDPSHGFDLNPYQACIAAWCLIKAGASDLDQRAQAKSYVCLLSHAFLPSTCYAG